MIEPAPSPDDGVVVYRATRRHVLTEAGAVLSAAGIPVLLPWRENLGYHRGQTAPGISGEGEAVVPASEADRARALLAVWEARGEARVREHLKELPAQLRRVALLAGICTLGAMTLTGHAWRSHPTAMGSFAAALLLLLLWEVPARLRSRRERTERERVAAVQPPRWFER